MRAGFFDPQGHKAWRRLPFLLPILGLLLAIFGPLDGAPSVSLGFGSYAIWHLLALIDLRQQRPIRATIECGPGYIDVTSAGLRNQRIRAADLTGATTALGESGTLLTLQHRKRTTPISIELESEADAEKVRHALGIGHGGFGEISWLTEVDPAKRGGFVGNVLGAIAGFGIAAAALSSDSHAGLIALLGFIGFIGTIAALVGAGSTFTPPNVVMMAAGIRLRTPRAWFALPYEGLATLEETPHQFVFGVPPPYHNVVVNKSLPQLGGLSPYDRAALKAQLMAAAQRARGMGAVKDDASGRVEVLRRNNETHRDWLARLDMAGQTLAAGAGYRGHSLDAEDLWTILEDPEAEPELRAGAARILRHAQLPDVRVRIDAALAAVRDDVTSRKLRIAIRDDVNDASVALANVEAEERAMQMSVPARHLPQL